MDAHTDLLLTVVYCMTDDFLLKRPENARRKITDAEIVALCVAQAILGIPSDPRFVAGPAPAPPPPFLLPLAPPRLAPPRVERPPPREPVTRGGAGTLGDALPTPADYGFCPSHSRHFWGFR